MPATIPCTHCPASLKVEEFVKDYASCAQCGTVQRIYAFPALFEGKRAGDFGEAVSVGDESTCYYHPEKKAVVVCEGCGRFLCSLCDLEITGAHICASCLEAGRGLEKEKVERSRYLYEELAFSAAFLSLILWFLAIPIGFYALYVSIRHWKKPGRFGGHPRFKKVLAGLIGGGMAMGSIVFLTIMIAGSGG